MQYHNKEAHKFLKDKAHARWHDETFWGMRQKRDLRSREIPEWEALRDASALIKDYSLSHLPELLEEFETKATANGAIVHWAKDAEEYRQIILDILVSHHVKRFIKSKSMLSEECELDPFLLQNGIDVTESDLGERILQLLHSRPSHIVVPALHITKEEVGDLFTREMGAEEGNDDPTYLTHVARRSMRNLYLKAQAAMTGANFAVADTGECIVCTNEGNADLGVSLCPLQITAFGLEKIIPNRESLAVFTRLLGRSATGQDITTYTAHYQKPHPNGEWHIIIVDNGRSKTLANENHRSVLRCLRCGACMNTCPVYRRSGGYSYSYFIPGPIGINLGMNVDPKTYSGNVSACSLCYSCQDVCPAKINLADQIYNWRQEMGHNGLLPLSKLFVAKSMQTMFTHPTLYKTALYAAPATHLIPHAVMEQFAHLNNWGKEREMPRFASQNFNQWWKKNQSKQHKDNEK